MVFKLEILCKQFLMPHEVYNFEIDTSSLPFSFAKARASELVGTAENRFCFFFPFQFSISFNYKILFNERHMPESESFFFIPFGVLLFFDDDDDDRIAISCVLCRSGTRKNISSQ
jgi:hypothetical protein